MNTNHWYPSGPIEYEDRLRKLSRPKPAHPITVFEVKPGSWFQEKRNRLFGLVRAVARVAGQIRQQESRVPSTLMRGDSPEA